MKTVNNHEKLLAVSKEALEFIIGSIPEFGNEYLLIEKLEEIIKQAEIE